MRTSFSGPRPKSDIEKGGPQGEISLQTLQSIKTSLLAPIRLKKKGYWKISPVPSAQASRSRMIHFRAFGSKSLSSKPFKDRLLVSGAMALSLWPSSLRGVNLLQGRLAEGTGLVAAWQIMRRKGVRS